MAINPGNISVCPVALNKFASEPIARSTLTASNFAGVIWLARDRFHIISYNLNCSGDSLPIRLWGVRLISVGLIASCASCAFLDFVL